jgi:hypothetical protein
MKKLLLTFGICLMAHTSFSEDMDHATAATDDTLQQAIQLHTHKAITSQSDISRNQEEMNNIADQDVMHRGCSCGGKATPIDDNEEPEVTKGCSCSKPRPKKTNETIADENDQEITNAHHQQHPITALTIDKSCSCSKPRPKRNTSDMKNSPVVSLPEEESDGELFIKSALCFIKILEGSITAHETGNIKNGLQNILQGISGIAEIVSKKQNPHAAYEQIVDYMQNLSETEQAALINIARSHTNA